jgi:hypothetical protein
MSSNQLIPERQVFPTHQLDIRVPIQVAKRKSKPKSVSDANDLLMSQRYNQCRRTVIKIEFKAYTRRGANELNYNALHGEHLMISCPTPGQARAVIKLIQRICDQIDGKFLDENQE